jgi:hypothetical protein
MDRRVAKIDRGRVKTQNRQRGVTDDFAAGEFSIHF